MSGIPQIDARTREMLFDEMRRSLKSKNIIVDKDDGEILSALVVLYSHMLADTIKRLNRTPEKHRAAFLNLAHTSPRPAWPSTGIVVFEVAAGYDAPVEMRRGTRVSADNAGKPISFRLLADLTALPANISDVYWCDAARGRYGNTQDLSRVYPRHKEHTQETAYKADFIFDNVFYNNNESSLFIEAFLNGAPVTAEALAASSRWSVSGWPQEDEDFLSLSVSANPDGGLRLTSPELIGEAESIRVRMELLDPAYAGLFAGGMYLMQPSGSSPPDMVLTSGRGLDASGFHPFGTTLHAFEECGIFCSRALSQRNAEITLRFELSLEVSEELLAEQPEPVDYKWIMRKPLPKPKPVVYEAFAKSVRLDYWDGATYREIRAKNGAALDFTRENPSVELTFTCPEDISPCEYYGKSGYYLRLSCGECDELYKLPRRVYTPYISGLGFSYSHTARYYPAAIESESFGCRQEMSLDANPPQALFECPKQGKTLLLGFDALKWKCRLKMYVSIDNQSSHKKTDCKLTAKAYGGQDDGVFPVYDFTNGLVESGSLWLDIPENLSPCTLFGKERYWIELSGFAEYPAAISGIFLNAQLVENRSSYEESFSYVHLKNNRLTLSHPNIARAQVYVRSLSDDEMKLWREYETTDGKFREGFYKLDAQSGLITFPDDITGRSIIEDALDLIRVTYDSTDGQDANVPAGSITRTEEDVPFIQSVRNPYAIVSGANSESADELGDRKRHALYNGGKIVSKRDFELFAIDNCPLVTDAKCSYDIKRKTVVLAVRMREKEQSSAFEKVQRDLKKLMLPLTREGLSLKIILWEDAP